MQDAGCETRPELLVCRGGPRRNRTGDPILTMNLRPPLCGPAFAQVAAIRSRYSYVLCLAPAEHGPKPRSYSSQIRSASTTTRCSSKTW
jgi:hypothetical protein